MSVDTNTNKCAQCQVQRNILKYLNNFIEPLLKCDVVEVPHVMRHHRHLTHISGSLTEQTDVPLNHHHVT